MNIILVSSHLKTAKTLNITPRFFVGAFLACVFVSLILSYGFSWVSVRFNLPFVEDMVAKEVAREVAKEQQKYHQQTEEYVRDNVSSLAIKLGEMQAQMLRLDSLSERIAKLSGVSLPSSDPSDKSGKENKDSRDGKGGPLVNPSLPFSTVGLQLELDRFSEVIERRRDELTIFESQLMERRIKSTLLPTLKPINAGVGSGFGRRIDPLAGIGASHEGQDFPADTGTQVMAAAGGVVIVAEYHSQYGNIIEIDHGNDFSSRYAHMSRLDVKSGQVVKRGQPIGASGNTGRSTGPHLHFEVRFKGVAQDPARFLKQSQTALVTSVAETALRPPATKKSKRKQ